MINYDCVNVVIVSLILTRYERIQIRHFLNVALFSNVIGKIPCRLVSVINFIRSLHAQVELVFKGSIYQIPRWVLTLYIHETSVDTKLMITYTHIQCC